MKKVAMKGTERGIMIGDLDVLASDASGFRRISFVGALNNTLTTSLSHSYHHTTPGMPAREILLDLWQVLGTLIILLLLLLLLSLSLSLLRPVTCSTQSNCLRTVHGPSLLPHALRGISLIFQSVRGPCVSNVLVETTYFATSAKMK